MIEKHNKYFFICFTLIFINIPKLIYITPITGVIGNKLIVYPLLIAIIYTFWCEYKYRNVLVHKKEFIQFICLYLGVMLISLLVGLFTFPYYESIFSHPYKHERLVYLLNIITSLGFDATYETGLPIFMFLNPLRKLFLDTIFSFGTAYLIYCWYYKNWQKAFKITSKAVLCSVAVIVFYSIVELFYLAKVEWAKDVLVIINPYLHIIKENHGWWPPLLWKNQIRSVFPEPSFFGIYTAFAIPILWYLLTKVKSNKHKLILGIVVTVFEFLIFMTKARTAVALLLGELILLVVYSLYVRNKEWLKNLLHLLSCTGLAFILMISFTQIFMNKTVNNIENEVTQYIDSNLTSIASTTKRSNTARFSTIYANIKIGMDNPILGVGKGMTPAYMPDYFPEMAKNNREVQNWIKYQREQGVLKMPIPSFSAFSLIFAEGGIIGFLAYFAPLILLMYKLLTKLRNKNVDSRYVFLTIALCGMLATGFSNTLNITWCYWVLLGLGYAMCFGKEQEAKETL